jgi:hypothetical protein
MGCAEVTQRQKVQDTLEEKLRATERERRNMEPQWNNIKKCVLGTMSELVVKVRRDL